MIGRTARNCAAVLCSALALSGCDLLEPMPCYDDRVEYTVEPGVKYVRVGESFTVKAYRLTCNRRVRTRDNPEWFSLNPEVARVDSRTGRVTTLAPGSAQINGELPGWSVYSAVVHVE